MGFSDKSVGFTMAVAAAMLWGTFGTFSNILRDMGVAAATVSLISPIFLVLVFVTMVARVSWRNFMIPKRLIFAIVLDGLAAALYNYAAVMAYEYLPIAIVSTIIYCNLFLLIVITRLIFKTPITRQKIVAICAAIVGITMVVNLYEVIQTGSFSLSIIGIVWNLLAMISWTTLLTCSKALCDGGVDGNAIIAYEGIFSLVILSVIIQSPVATFHNLAAVFASSHGLVILPILGFGVFTTGLCYWLYIHAVARMDPAYVQIGYTMDPVTSSLLGLFLFHQTLKPVQFAGILLIVALVIWIEISEVKEARKTLRAAVPVSREE